MVPVTRRTYFLAGLHGQTIRSCALHWLLSLRQGALSCLGARAALRLEAPIMLGPAAR